VDNVRGRLYIANREGEVVDAWSLSDGSFVKRYPTVGPIVAHGFPRDVAVNQSSGTFYVADERNSGGHHGPRRVHVGVITRYGAGSGQAIGTPFAVCVDGQGNLAVQLALLVLGQVAVGLHA
jgi:DNA-binding beta-propeller fold protein YncE